MPLTEWTVETVRGNGSTRGKVHKGNKRAPGRDSDEHLTFTGSFKEEEPRKEILKG